MSKLQDSPLPQHAGPATADHRAEYDTTRLTEDAPGPDTDFPASGGIWPAGHHLLSLSPALQGRRSLFRR